MKYIAAVEGREYDIGLVEAGVVSVGDARHNVDLQSIDGGFHYSLLLGAISYEVFVEQCDDVCFVTIEGHRYRVEVEDERHRRSGAPVGPATEEPGEWVVTSPMPGVVVAVLVQEGDSVMPGQGLAILEAMKMENEIRAPRSGIVEMVGVSAGQKVGKGDELVRIGPPDN